jgi:hypothetical protein
VRLYGAGRIVCGTDGTEFGCEWTAKALAETEIGEEAREKILHGNAAAIVSPFVTICISGSGSRPTIIASTAPAPSTSSTTPTS